MSRFGLPYEWICGLVAVMLRNGRRHDAAALALSFDACLRPGEVVDLRKEDVIAHVTRCSGYGRWAVVIQPETRGQPSKTGWVGDMVMVGELDIPLADVLWEFKAGDPMETFFGVTVKSYKEAFDEAAMQLGLRHELLNTCTRDPAETRFSVNAPWRRSERGDGGGHQAQ